MQNKVKVTNEPWNRAMDEVRADRLIGKHGKNALLVIIQEWPQKNKYKDKPELIPSLEYLVRKCLIPAFDFPERVVSSPRTQLNYM